MKRRCFVLLIFTACLLTGCGKTPEEAIPATESAVASAVTTAPTQPQETVPGKIVAPLDLGLDWDEVRNYGQVRVSFDGEDVSREGDQVMLRLTVYDYEKFDDTEILQLQVGDVLRIDGEDVLIHSIENDGWLHINGGIDDEGVTLMPYGIGVYVQIFENEAKNYFPAGQITLPVSEEFLFTDGSLPVEMSMLKTLENLIAEMETEGRTFSPYDTSVSTYDGWIIGLRTFYVP